MKRHLKTLTLTLCLAAAMLGLPALVMGSPASTPSCRGCFAELNLSPS